MPDLFPVHKVPAMEKRNSGEVFERTGHEIIVAASPADAGVGMKTSDNRILVSLCTAGYAGEKKE